MLNSLCILGKLHFIFINIEILFLKSMNYYSLKKYLEKILFKTISLNTDINKYIIFIK